MLIKFCRYGSLSSKFYASLICASRHFNSQVCCLALTLMCNQCSLLPRLFSTWPPIWRPAHHSPIFSRSKVYPLDLVNTSTCVISANAPTPRLFLSEWAHFMSVNAPTPRLFLSEWAHFMSANAPTLRLFLSEWAHFMSYFAVYRCIFYVRLFNQMFRYFCQIDLPVINIIFLWRFRIKNSSVDIDSWCSTLYNIFTIFWHLTQFQKNIGFLQFF